jgi:hypothetical protein
MPHYLVAGILPDNFDPSTQDEATVHDINVLNDELEAAGARIFAGGLSAASQAKSLRAQPNGEVLITDGPYLEAKEHVGGFTILEALTWTRHWVGPQGCHRLPDAGRVARIPYSSLPNGTPHPSRQRKP